MASRLGSYEAAGEADPARALKAASLDLLVSAVVALVLWPFPLVRLTLAVPWAVHVPLIVLWALLVFVLYLALSVLAWGRTPAMYFLDLGLEPMRPRPAAAFRWAFAWVLAIVPALLGARGLAHPVTGLPARLAHVATVAAAPAQQG